MQDFSKEVEKLRKEYPRDPREFLGYEELKMKIKEEKKNKKQRKEYINNSRIKK